MFLRRVLNDCTVGDSFSVVAPAVPDMAGCYIWDDDYLNPSGGLYGYFHEEFGPTRPWYISGGPVSCAQLERHGRTAVFRTIGDDVVMPVCCLVL